MEEKREREREREEELSRERESSKSFELMVEFFGSVTSPLFTMSFSECVVGSNLMSSLLIRSNGESRGAQLASASER